MRGDTGFRETLELPAGNHLQFLEILDTTGSMYSCLLEARRSIDAQCRKLFNELGNVEGAAMAVGDYCDRRSTYVTVGTQLTTNAGVLSRFINNVSRTSGGDLPEAYEEALFQGLKLKWDPNPNTIKLVVLVGDDVPHRKGERVDGVLVQHDWRDMARQYYARGIRIAAVQCLGHYHAQSFYKELASITDGYYFQLGQFRELNNLILGLCYAQESFQKFEAFTRVVEAQGPLSRSVYENFDTISRGRSVFSREARDRFVPRSDGLIPVPPGRFQLLRVTEKKPVREFIADHGLIFVKGGVFYEWTMSETIQAGKKVVIRDRITGDMFTGDAARRLIGAEPGVKVQLSPKTLNREFRDRHQVFVQSTSYTRNMDPDTDVLFMDRYSDEAWAIAA